LGPGSIYLHFGNTEGKHFKYAIEIDDGKYHNKDFKIPPKWWLASGGCIFKFLDPSLTLERVKLDTLIWYTDLSWQMQSHGWSGSRGQIFKF